MLLSTPTLIPCPLNRVRKLYLWTQKVSRYFLFMDWQDLRVGTQWQKVQLEVMRRGHCGVESSVASREWPGEAVRWQVSSGGKASSGILWDCQFKFDSPGVQLILWGVYTPTETFFVCVSPRALTCICNKNCAWSIVLTSFSILFLKGSWRLRRYEK